MTRTGAGRLYTPEMLALATGLSKYPPSQDLPLHGRSRSQTCGGQLDLDLALDDRCIAEVGMMVQACAVGQASAAIFADWIGGRTVVEAQDAGKGVSRWLAGDSPAPQGPDLSPIAAARAYPSRHGAILLPWNALADTLCNGAGEG